MDYVCKKIEKKLRSPLQEWALDSKGWHISGSDSEYDISQLDPDEYNNVTFYKERWEPTRMSTGEVLEIRVPRKTDGELAQIENFSLNQDMIDQESRFDGFYGICTDKET